MKLLLLRYLKCVTTYTKRKMKEVSTENQYNLLLKWRQAVNALK